MGVPYAAIVDNNPMAPYISDYTKPIEECVDVDIPIDQIKSGEFKYFHWVKGKIGIYRPTQGDIDKIQKHELLPAKIDLPPWWVQKDNPAISTVDEFYTHNINEGVFVFWQWSPIYGCGLFYFPERSKENTKLPGPKFLGSDWDGGFVDLCTMRAFDYYGRLVKFDAEYKPEKTFPSFVLVKPHYSISENTIHLKCKL